MDPAGIPEESADPAESADPKETVDSGLPAVLQELLTPDLINQFLPLFLDRLGGHVVDGALTYSCPPHFSMTLHVDLHFMTNGPDGQRAHVFIHLQTPDDDEDGAEVRGFEYVRDMYDAWKGELPCYGIVVLQPTNGIQGIVCHCRIPRSEEDGPITEFAMTLEVSEEERKKLNPWHENFRKNCETFGLLKWLLSALIYGSQFEYPYPDMPEAIYNLLIQLQSVSEESLQERTAKIIVDAHKCFVNHGKSPYKFVDKLRRTGERVEWNDFDGLCDNPKNLFTRQFIYYLKRNGIEMKQDQQGIWLETSR
jgi:hypothetical protein